MHWRLSCETKVPISKSKEHFKDVSTMYCLQFVQAIVRLTKRGSQSSLDQDGSNRFWSQSWKIQRNLSHAKILFEEMLSARHKYTIQRDNRIINIIKWWIIKLISKIYKRAVNKIRSRLRSCDFYSANTQTLSVWITSG